MLFKIGFLKTYNFIKKSLQRSCFPKNLRNFLRTLFFREHLLWLLKQSENEKLYSHEDNHWKTPVIVSHLVRLQSSGVTLIRKRDSMLNLFCELCKFLQNFYKRVLLNHALISTQLHPPPPSSTQLILTSTQLHPPDPTPPSSFHPPPSSLQHSQQHSNQNITRNWAIYLKLGRNIKNCSFPLNIGSHGADS